METNYKELFDQLISRYSGADPQALIQILCPMLIPIQRLDKKVFKAPGQNHYRASFWIAIDESSEKLIIRGRTGKFVPKDYVRGGIWREIAKGRIIEVDHENGIAAGEVYIGGTKKELIKALDELTEGDYLEIDQYGAAAKVLSGLVEYSFVQIAKQSGYKVTRMPEDMARHLGVYYHYDFEIERDGATKRVEVKSLWGTNTKCARLIHSKSREYPTSSCRFDTQDIFAVNLFLRTGDIRDFAFARSIPIGVRPYGLPTASNYPEYVNQNPSCEIGDGSWFGSIDEVWGLD